MKLTLRTRLVAMLIGAVIAALVVACTAFVVYDRSSYVASRAQTLRVLADSLSGSAAGAIAFQDRDAAAYVLRTVAAEPMALSAAALDAEGHTLAEWRRAGPSHESHTMTVEAAVRSEGAVVGRIRLVFSTRDVDARSRRFVQIAGLVLALTALASTLLAMRLHRLVTDPVGELAGAAHRVRSAGDFTVRAKRMSDDELGLLTDAFNEMLDGIQTRDADLEAHRRGLESTVEARTRDLATRNDAMRLVLDNVEQGLVTIDREGHLATECSTAFAEWFGAPDEADLGHHLDAGDGRFATAFEIGWSQVIDDFLPREVSTAQLPATVSRNGRQYALSFRLLGRDDEPVKGALALIRDVTEELRQREAEAAQREFVTAVERALNDRRGFEDFLTETDVLLATLAAGEDRTVVARMLHTIKGNCAIYGLTSIAARCHALEDKMAEGETVTPDDVNTLTEAWRATARRLSALFGERSDHVELPREALREACNALILAGRTAEAAALRRWGDEPVGPRLARMGDRAKELAERLERVPVEIEVIDDNVRVPRERWASVWSAMVHVVRNAVDHGLETPEEREEASKPPTATLTLRTRQDRQGVTLEIADDGRGIDWDRVRAKATRLGLPCETQAQLQEVLFSDGFSTRDEATDTSGRGVGMGAFAEAVRALGGTVTLTSKRGRGTTVSAFIPHAPATASFARRTVA